jgi:hypothetical protein
MSVKTLIGLIVLLLLIWGIFQLIGTLAEKKDPASSYIRESVRTIDKVQGMKEDRSAVIKEREKALTEEND